MTADQTVESLHIAVTVKLKGMSPGRLRAIASAATRRALDEVTILGSIARRGSAIASVAQGVGRVRKWSLAVRRTITMMNSPAMA